MILIWSPRGVRAPSCCYPAIKPVQYIQYIFSLNLSKQLKELQNYIFCIIQGWSFNTGLYKYPFSTYSIAQQGIIYVSIFYLFFWKTSFLSFCVLCFLLVFFWVCCNLYRFYNICVIIVYIDARCSVILFSRYKN